MAKPLKDIIGGKGTSHKKKNDLGGYAPKAGDEQKFAQKHDIEVHDDRNGNGDDVFKGTTKEAPFKKQNPSVYEAKEVEEAKCNVSAKGTHCPVHGLAECSYMKKINESDFKTALPGIMKDIKSKKMSAQQLRQTHGTHYKTLANMTSNKHGAKYTRSHMLAVANQHMNEEVEQVDEVITKKTSAGEVISDFVHSKNPKFAGKSKEKRKQMALAAYYAKQRNEEKIQEVYPAQPLLGGASSDESVDMVKAELRALANKATHLVMNMPSTMHVEPWVQAKIAQAKSMVTDVHDYCTYGDHENEDMADTSGASGGSAGGSMVMNQMDTPLTFPNMSVDVNTGHNV